MTELAVASGVALWLGIVTSLSPCPLTTNIAAVAYIGRRLDKPGATLWAGALYALGRSVAYIALAALIVRAVVAVPALSHGLQKYGIQILGPVLILAALFLLQFVKLPEIRLFRGNKTAERAAEFGMAGAALLGLLFALSFCPVSAALYFGSLIPLSVTQQSVVLVPLLYGVGTALPVVAFTGLAAAGAQSLNHWFDVTARLERWGRLGTGVLFLAVGIYYTLAHSLDVF